MAQVLEFFWPNGERPGCALRWDVEAHEAHVDVCSATTASHRDGRPDEDIVLSDGGARDDTPLDGAWIPEFTLAVKFDGFARMWCEDLQLGTVGEAVALGDLFRHIYERAEVLISQQSKAEDEQIERERAERQARREERLRRRAP